MGASVAPFPTFLILALLSSGPPCSCNVTRTDDLPPSVPTAVQNVSKKETRPRRDVLLLYNVVACATGCNPIQFMGYGCYCGFMGAGEPVDQIDKCCQQHDRCYDHLPCPQKMLYFIPYKWTCVRRKPLCHGAQKVWHHPSNCAYRMCECDRLFGECLRSHSCPKRKAACRSAPWRTLQNLLLGLSIAG